MVCSEGRLEAAVEGSAALAAHQREVDAEKARLAYVALTRAKVRLYAPIALGENLKESLHAKPGTASPMELLTARLGGSPLDEPALYARMNDQSRELQLINYLNRYNNLFSYEYTNSNTMIEPIHEEPAPQLVSPEAWNPEFPSITMHSYTSLARKTVIEEHGSFGGPHDYHNPLRTVHTIPAGKDVGIALHTVFEQLPFHTARSRRDIEAYVPPWLGEWSPILAEMVYQTLHARLPLPTGPFSLQQLTPANRLTEWEFLIPTEEGFIKGFVDLIFQHEGLYYLVDWKSNWLGPDAESYTQLRLEMAMEAENYDLQLQIYTEALRRYLAKIDKRPFEDCFGGAFYLFSRGIGEGMNGIYYRSM